MKRFLSRPFKSKRNKGKNGGLNEKGTKPMESSTGTEKDRRVCEKRFHKKGTGKGVHGTPEN